MASAKEAHELVTYYIKAFEKKYHRTPIVNRFSARWGFDSILLSTPEREIKSLLDYYFQTISPNEHSLDWFFYNYEKLAVSKGRSDEDIAHLKRLREESERRTEEWRNRLGKG